MGRDPVLAVTAWWESGINSRGKESKYRYRLRVTGGLNYLRGNSAPYFSITADTDSITADTDRRPANGGVWKEHSGGCMHEIERRFPGKFSDLIALHLSNIDGEPMHAESNGWYHLSAALGGLGETYHAGNSKRQHWNADGSFDAYREPTPDECLESFARHCRITLAEAVTIRARVQLAYESENVIPAILRMTGVPVPLSNTEARKTWAAIMETMRERWAREANACIVRLSLVVYGDAWQPDPRTEPARS